MSDEQLLIYNAHLTQNWYVYALGADKTKWLMKHTATITKVKIDHTKRQLLTHRAPPGAPTPPSQLQPTTGIIKIKVLQKINKYD